MPSKTPKSDDVAATPGRVQVIERAVITGLPNPVDQPTMTLDEVAPFLGLSRASTYQAAKLGQIPTIRFGRRLVVPTAALRRMLGIDAA